MLEFANAFCYVTANEVCGGTYKCCFSQASVNKTAIPVIVRERLKAQLLESTQRTKI